MANKEKKFGIFDGFAVAITVFVIIFISTVILTIVVRGIPFLGTAFVSDEVQFAIRLSLYTSTISTLICMVLAMPVAYTMTRLSFPLKRFFQVIMELPLSMPFLVLGLSLLLIFSSDLGKALKDMGFRVIFDKNGIILAQTIVNLPYVIRLTRTAFEEVDERLELIAGILGASKWKRFVTITLPLVKNALISTVILTWSRGLGEFGATLMLVGATRMKTETLPTSIYLNIATGDLGAAMASAMVILIISLLSLCIANLLGRKNNEASRLKDVHLR